MGVEKVLNFFGGGIVKEVGEIADNLFTSDEERLEKELEMKKSEREFTLENKRLDTQLMQGQIDTNKIEAQHPDWFVARWRPAVGWVGVIALFFMYVPKAIVMTAVWCYAVYKTFDNGITVGAADILVNIPAIPEFPDLGAGEIIGLLMSILGVGIMRSYDKKQGTDTKQVSRWK